MYNYHIEMIDGTVVNLTSDEKITEDHSGLFEYDHRDFINLDHAKYISITKAINWEEN